MVQVLQEKMGREFHSLLRSIVSGGAASEKERGRLPSKEEGVVVK
jgi:hypothetical protein